VTGVRVGDGTAAPVTARSRLLARQGSVRVLGPALAIPVLLYVVSELIGNGTVTQEVTLAMIYVIAVVGLYVFTGLTGVVSWGHAGFMAIGAYAGAILTMSPADKGILLPALPHFLATFSLGTVSGMVVAAAFAAVIAAIVSIPLMPLGGIAASLSTLAFLLIVYVVIGNWTAVTRGQQTLLGYPTNTTVTSAFVVAVVVIAGAYWFERSYMGRRCKAHREDEIAARAYGIGGTMERRVALVLSAFIMGLAGFVYAQFIGSLDPAAFYLDLTFLILAMLVVGGMFTSIGPVLGAVVIWGVQWGLQSFETKHDLGIFVLPGVGSLPELGVAVLLLLVLIFYPEGLAGAGRHLDGLWRRTRALAGRVPDGEGRVPDGEAQVADGEATGGGK
jgi:branched-chain amino acid transport system permease protein